MFFLYLLLSEGFATNPHDFYISEEVPLMTELEWDSGWLPNSGNIQIKFQTVADGGAFIDVEGVANLDWSEVPSSEPKNVALSINSQKNLFEQYGEGDPNELMGIIELSNQLRTVISIQFSIASYSWSSSFDVTEIDFGNNMHFEPFLIGETLTIEASDDESNVFQLDFQPIPTVNLYARIEMEPQSTLNMTGLSFDTIPVPVSYSLDELEQLSIAELVEEVDVQSIVGDEPVYHPSQKAAEMFFLGEYVANYELNNSLVFAPVLEVCIPIFGCYEWEVVQLPAANFESYFDHRYTTEILQFDLPQISIENEFINIESTIDETTLSVLSIHNKGNETLEVTGRFANGSFIDIFPDSVVIPPQEESYFTIATQPLQTSSSSEQEMLYLESNDPFSSLIEIPINVTISKNSYGDNSINDNLIDSELDKEIIVVEQGCGCQSTTTERQVFHLSIILIAFFSYRRRM